jgi:hypothetical protein
MILRNSIKCNHCNDEIESKHVHDFVTCKCGKVSVDGGLAYGKTMFTSLSDFINTSINDDGTHELRREHLKWGNNYDKDMNALPETMWIPIKDMSSEHIQAILDGGYVKNNYAYQELFKEELEFRNNK